MTREVQTNARSIPSMGKKSNAAGLDLASGAHDRTIWTPKDLEKPCTSNYAAYIVSLFS